MHRAVSNEKVFVSEISYIINDKNIIITSVQERKPVSCLSDKFYEEKAFPYFLSKGKLCYKAH